MKFKFKRPSLFSCLVIVIFLVLVPTLIVVAMILQRTGESSKQVSEARLLETAYIVSQSVQSETEALSRLLQGFTAFSNNKNLTTESLAFGSDIEPITGTSLNILRRDDDGNLPLSSPLLKRDLIRELVLYAATTQRLQLSNIYRDEAGNPRIAIAAPQTYDTEQPDVTLLESHPLELIRTLERKNVVSGSVVLAVTDGAGLIIGRSVDGPRFVGRPVPDWHTLTALGTSEGTFRAETLEGNQIIFAFQTIPGTPGWVAVVGEAASSFDARWQQPIWIMLGTSSIAILIAVGLALLLARKALQPVKLLARRAENIALEIQSDEQTLPVEVPTSFILEFETLRQNLDRAEKKLRDSLYESRRAEKALRESNAILTETEKLARIGSWTLDLATGKFMQSAMMHELNATDPQSQPLKQEDLSSLLSPKSYPLVMAAIERCIQTGEPYAMEIEHMRPNGKSFATYLQGKAQRDESGKIVKLTGILQDISERKEQQQRLAILADNLPGGVMFRLEKSDRLGGRIIYMSAGIEELIGIPASDIIADTHAMINRMHDDDKDKYYAAIQRSLDTGELLSEELRVQHLNGEMITVQLRAVLRELLDGRIIWDGIALDVTSERKAVQALHDAKEIAEAAERAKSDFLATMSHEIRTPMNTVIGMTRLVLQTNLDERQKNYLQKINSSAVLLLGIINDILDVSKIEAGKLELEKTTFTLESVLESVAAINQLKADEKNLELSFSINPDVPSTLIGDPLRLGQIITNLVGNAVKFSESGDIVVSVQHYHGPHTNQNPQLLFSVSDMGIGLTEAQIKNLFQPFSQATEETTRRYGGTGLGLAICKRLTELMGGTIWVESESGKGSSFSFTLPLQGATDSVSNFGYKVPANLYGSRVLIVDDSDSARRILQEMLTSFGMTSETAENGEDALKILQAHAEQGKTFDLVLLDWRMPGMDGLALAKAIRSQQNLIQIPAILMVTAYGHEVVLRSINDAELNGVLLKPVTQSVLFNSILEVLDPNSDLSDLTNIRHNTHGITEQRDYALLKDRHVLLVDDNALNREVATDFLELVNVNVTTAENGLEAINKMKTQDFDIVLMDMHMPVMDGLEAIREIRRHQRWHDLPVIALTAQARLEDFNASLEAGMTAHLTKPIDEHALYSTLLNALQKDSGTDTNQLANTMQATRKKEFDLDSLQQRFRGNTDRVVRILDGFIRDYKEAPEKLADFLVKNNMDDIAALVHQIRSSAGYFGAQIFCEAAEQVEHAARDKDVVAVSEHIQDCVRHLKTLLIRVTEAAGIICKPAALSEQQDYDKILASLDLALSLIKQGDFAVNAILDNIATALVNPVQRKQLSEAQELYEDLELEAATERLRSLRDSVWQMIADRRG